LSISNIKERAFSEGASSQVIQELVDPPLRRLNT
jgi:hypothetical protein